MDRRFPIQAFDPERFASFFGIQSRQLRHQRLTGGACNSNYLVETPNGDRFVCRFHLRGDAQIEQMITRMARDLAPCPEYLWVGNGVSVQSYLEGEHFQPTDLLMQHAGRIIGEFAQHSLYQSGMIQPDGTIQPFEGWASTSDGINQLLEHPKVQAYLSAPQRNALKALLKKEASRLSDFDACHNLVHGDFRPDNLLVKNDSIVGVVDWEFAHSGCSYMDIGNLLRHVGSEWEPSLKQGLVDTGFELPSDWSYRAALIDLNSHLEFLTSDRSHVFKLSRVTKIEALLNRRDT